MGDEENASLASVKHVVIYTDGACSGNPGRGGYGVVMKYGDKRKEISAGYRKTTNNRMEVLAAIAGLEALRYKCKVTLYTDSQYLTNTITKGWAKGWRARGWKKKDNSAALNVDLWIRMLDLCEKHDLEIVWVKGHAGNPENERCDELAVAAAQEKELLVDAEYEK